MEPFDDSMPEILKNNGIHTHLVSDHYHYWEEGGCNYHTRYNTWEISRGQEGDPWKGDLRPIDIPPTINQSGTPWHLQDRVNRSYMQSEELMPQARTFAMGLEFLHTNAKQENWFLQIETFDPHEPYFSAQKYKDLYPHEYNGPSFDWPYYRKVQETPEQVMQCRYENAALVSMCDAHLGKVLDAMDELDLWKDTLLIVNTDHGFLLSEHDWWGKCAQPFYNEIAHTPLFIWDPRCGITGERRTSLVQTIDIPATLLEYFGASLPADMQGKPLAETVLNDAPIREAALFGLHGGHVNVTDAHYVYMRAPINDANTPLFEYTLMPTHMRHTFETSELQDIHLSEPFRFTKGCRTMKIAGRAWINAHAFGSLLFDIKNDPKQENPITDSEIEAHMIEHMTRLMHENDSPEDQFIRLGLPRSY
jgi:arylsulfatase A-like enzyme